MFMVRSYKTNAKVNEFELTRKKIAFCQAFSANFRIFLRSRQRFYPANSDKFGAGSRNRERLQRQGAASQLGKATYICASPERKYLRMRIWGYVLGGMLLVVMSDGCTKVGSPIGANYINDNLNVLYIDTLTLRTSTVLLDSIPTSATSVILSGGYQDPYFGQVNAVSYMEIGIPAINSVLPNAIFDSCIFVLKPNGYYYGDSTQLQEFSIYTLRQNIIANTITDRLYNVDSVPLNPVPLGQTSFLPSPGVSRFINIRLNDSFGDTLTKLMSTKDLRIIDQVNFRNFLDGIAVVGGPSNTGVMGFSIGSDSAAVIRLYIHYPGLTPVEASIDFPVTNNAAQFNHITANRSGTPLSGLSATDVLGLASSSTNHETFVESGTGIATRISIPYIGGIQLLAQYGAIVRARLVVQPEQYTYKNNLFLPEELMLLDESNANTVIDTLTATGGVRMNGALSIDYVHNLNTAYTYDVTSYVSALLNNPGKGIGTLLLITPYIFNATGVDRIVLGDQRQPNTTMKLEIYYIVYNQVP
jgi:hypothetical protein